MDFDVIIIGGGPAGLNAALYAGRANLKTLILEPYGVGGQLNYINHIDNYLGFSGSGIELSEKMREQALSFGAVFSAELVLEISHAHGGLKRVKTRKNEYICKNIIFATGASPRLLGVDGEERFKGLGVSYCATCDGAFYKDKTAVIVGGGNTAFSEALYLAKLCKEVYLIHRSESFRASASLIEQVKQNPKITIRTNEVVDKIQGDDKVKSVVLKHTLSSRISVLETACVFVAAGRLPNSSLLKELVRLDANGYVITDGNMRTNVSGIYAIGDVRQTPLRQIATAVSDGAIAANDIALIK